MQQEKRVKRKATGVCPSLLGPNILWFVRKLPLPHCVPFAIMVVITSTATTGCTGLFEDWRKKNRKQQQHRGFYLTLSTMRTSLSHFASQNLRAFPGTLSVCKNAHFWAAAALRPGLETKISKTKHQKVIGGLVALRILILFPNLSATIYFSEFSSSCSCILSLFYSFIQ